MLFKSCAVIRVPSVASIPTHVIPMSLKLISDRKERNPDSPLPVQYYFCVLEKASGWLWHFWAHTIWLSLSPVDFEIRWKTEKVVASWECINSMKVNISIPVLIGRASDTAMYRVLNISDKMDICVKKLGMDRLLSIPALRRLLLVVTWYT